MINASTAHSLNAHPNIAASATTAAAVDQLAPRTSQRYSGSDHHPPSVEPWLSSLALPSLSQPATLSAFEAPPLAPRIAPYTPITDANVSATSSMSDDILLWREELRGLLPLPPPMDGNV